MATEIIQFNELKRELPYKWRVQSFSQYKPEATCVAYVDSRDVQKLLDEVAGPENWQDEYYAVKNNLFCRIGIRVNGEWTWKGDCGTESNVDKEKGEASDAFKRAAVKWGIGRFLYDLGMYKLKASAALVKGQPTPYPVDDNGQRIWEITKHINALIKAQKAAKKATARPEPPKPSPEKVATAEAALKAATEPNRIGLEEALENAECYKELLQNEVWTEDERIAGLQKLADNMPAEIVIKSIRAMQKEIDKRSNAKAA